MPTATGTKVTKDEIVSAIRAQLVADGYNADHVTKAAASAAYDAVCNVFMTGLTELKSLPLGSLGTFRVSKQSARTGRNPQTGEQIPIAAHYKVSFAAGKALKDSLPKVKKTKKTKKKAS